VRGVDLVLDLVGGDTALLSLPAQAGWRSLSCPVAQIGPKVIPADLSWDVY
jgi:hypothetical protein